MSSYVSGTFSGTGQSAVARGRKVQVVMDFAGTASVDIEAQTRDGSWIKIETAITADKWRVVEDPIGIAVRLNCTSHTDNVVYSLEGIR